MADGKVLVEGPRASWSSAYHRHMKIKLDEAAQDASIVTRPDDERQPSLHGLTRSLIANMVEGVTKGYEKRLKIEGIGYQAQLDKKAVVLTVGYANADRAGAARRRDGRGCPTRPPIVVKGADKQKVGQFAAEVRHARKPEPYKGKGIRYENEEVRRKEGKSFASGG